MSLKQRCLRDLHLRASSRSLHLIDVLGIHGIRTAAGWREALGDELEKADPG
jgi:hypothetical protein